MEWRHMNEMFAIAQKMGQEPEQRRVERGPLAPIARISRGLGTLSTCGGAALVDIATAIREKLRGVQ
ncbi:MAG: hypothetical protein ABIG34_02005 [Candidatus Peregrinibacteria bacterium]